MFSASGPSNRSWSNALGAPTWRDGGILRDVWGTGPDDVWVLDSIGVVHRWDGVEWSPLPFEAAAHSLRGSRLEDLWLAGPGGRIFHWDGIELQLASSGTTRDLFGLWAGGDDTVWAVGEVATILRMP